ncbi:MAG: ATP-binding protein [Candidatus Omnitrophica bacterium]|nr:ATP-binding protein [Candidatus Omnitrophota bacterium]
METKPRFLKVPKSSFFLFGPRGTGKSLWLKQTFPKSIYLDFLSPEVFRAYASSPERLEAVIAGNPAQKNIIIDEVQKVPEVLSVVHQMIEKDKTLRFVLTGSSPRKLKRTGIDLLGGRAAIKTLHPFMAAELGKDFRLETALEQGLLPLVWTAQDPKITLDAYIGLYLREEVKMEGLVRNIGAFTRFLETLSLSHGSILSLSEIARECEVERKTVEGYISVLEDLLLAFRLPVFTKKAKRHLVQHPKFYYFDAGVFQTLRPRGPLNSPQEISGVALEGLMAQHLRAWQAYTALKTDLYYWRTKSGVEVDFIIYGQDTFLAMEVKSSRTIHPQDLNGLLSFKEDYPQASLVILYRGRERLCMKNVLCLPCEKFLTALDPGKSIQHALAAETSI